MDSQSLTSQSDAGTTDASQGPPDSGEKRKRVLKKRKIGNRPNPSQPLVWKDIRQRMQWGLLSWLPLYAVSYFSYDEEELSQNYGPMVIPYLLYLGCLFAFLNEGLFPDRFFWGYYVLSFVLGCVMGVDFLAFLPHPKTRALFLTLFGIACGQLRYHWYKRRSEYPSLHVISAAFAIGEVLACVWTHEDGLWYLMWTAFGYSFFLVVPLLAAESMSKTVDLIKMCFGTSSSLADSVGAMNKAYWLGSTVASVGLLLMVGGGILVYLVPFALHCQLFLTPYGCVLEMVSVAALRTPVRDQYSEVGNEHKAHIHDIHMKFGKQTH